MNHHNFGIVPALKLFFSCRGWCDQWEQMVIWYRAEDGSKWKQLLLRFLLEPLHRSSRIRAAQISDQSLCTTIIDWFHQFIVHIVLAWWNKVHWVSGMLNMSKIFSTVDPWKYIDEISELGHVWKLSCRERRQFSHVIFRVSNLHFNQYDKPFLTSSN